MQIYASLDGIISMVIVISQSPLVPLGQMLKQNVIRWAHILWQSIIKKRMSTFNIGTMERNLGLGSMIEA